MCSLTMYLQYCILLKLKRRRWRWVHPYCVSQSGWQDVPFMPILTVTNHLPCYASLQAVMGSIPSGIDPFNSDLAGLPLKPGLYFERKSTPYTQTILRTWGAYSRPPMPIYAVVIAQMASINTLLQYADFYDELCPPFLELCWSGRVDAGLLLANKK